MRCAFCGPSPATPGEHDALVEAGFFSLPVKLMSLVGRTGGEGEMLKAAGWYPKAREKTRWPLPACARTGHGWVLSLDSA